MRIDSIIGAAAARLLVMLGALAKVSDVVKVDGAKAAVKTQLGGKLSDAVLDANYQAIERAYEEVK